MKFLKKFTQHADYTSYMASNQKVFPNVSYCVDNNDVHYNPWTDPKLVCKYNITDTSSATTLRTEYEQNIFKSMEIDGILLDSLVTSYQFDTTGEHTVKYELYDETKVGNNAPLFNNITALTSVSIPNSVTTIGTNAFYGCSGLTSVTISNSVTTIGDTAFSGCSGLTSITIGNGVTTIGEGAFQGCTGLTSITIPNSVIYIGTVAFGSCIGLTSIKVDSGNTAFDSRNNCNAIIETATNTLIAGCKNTVIPNSVTTIGSYAFQNCTGLRSVTIPNGVTTIGNNAFNYCSSLTSVTIPNGVTTIGTNAFSSTGITSITIPDSVTTIGDYAFGGGIGLTSIEVDSGNTVYDSRNNCNAIIETATNTLIAGCKNTVIPNSVTSIRYNAFASCHSLTSITIPDSVTTIGNYAFSNCSSLTSVIIGNGVTTIGNNTFYYCRGLTSVTVQAATPPSLGSSVFNSNATGRKIYVPSASVATYKAASGWSSYASDIEAIPSA